MRLVFFPEKKHRDSENPISTQPLLERNHERCSELMISSIFSSAKILLLGVKLIFIDLSPRIPLT